MKIELSSDQATELIRQLEMSAINTRRYIEYYSGQRDAYEHLRGSWFVKPYVEAIQRELVALAHIESILHKLKG